jgi:hypothetical protein
MLYGQCGHIPHCPYNIKYTTLTYYPGVFYSLFIQAGILIIPEKRDLNPLNNNLVDRKIIFLSNVIRDRFYSPQHFNGNWPVKIQMSWLYSNEDDTAAQFLD